MGERSPNRNTDGDLEILKSRIVSSLLITSEQNLTRIKKRYLNVGKMFILMEDILSHQRDGEVVPSF